MSPAGARYQSLMQWNPKGGKTFRRLPFELRLSDSLLLARIEELSVFEDGDFSILIGVCVNWRHQHLFVLFRNQFAITVSIISANDS